MDDVKPKADAKPKAPKTVNITIKSMGGRFATGGLNLASGKKAKLLAGEVCEVPEATYRLVKANAELSDEKADCFLVGDEIVR